MSRGRIVAGAVAIIIVLSGCSNEQRADSLTVGDCFDDTEAIFAGEEFVRVPSVPCLEPHDNEVFHVAQYPGSTYDLDELDRFADIVCYGAFEPYVGRSYETSIIDYGWFFPTQDSWSTGDREITCIAFHMDLEKLTRSVRGSGL